MSAKKKIMKLAHEREGQAKVTLAKHGPRTRRHTNCAINYAIWWCSTHNCALTEDGFCPK